MERRNEIRRSRDQSFRAARYGDASRTQHLLMRIPILLFAAIGLAFGLTRFIFVVRDNLRGPTSSLGAALFLAAMVAGAALLIVFAGAAVGFLIGLVLQLGYGSWRSRRIERPAL